MTDDHLRDMLLAAGLDPETGRSAAAHLAAPCDAACAIPEGQARDLARFCGSAGRLMRHLYGEREPAKRGIDLLSVAALDAAMLLSLAPRAVALLSDSPPAWRVMATLVAVWHSLDDANVGIHEPVATESAHPGLRAGRTPQMLH